MAVVEENTLMRCDIRIFILLGYVGGICRLAKQAGTPHGYDALEEAAEMVERVIELGVIGRDEVD